MHKIALLSLAFLVTSCTWAGRQSDSFMGWANRNMPLFDESDRQAPKQPQAEARAVPPAPVQAAPLAAQPQYYQPVPPNVSFGQPMPHSFNNTNYPGGTQPQNPEDDFPAEYQHVGTPRKEINPNYIQRPDLQHEMAVPSVPNMPTPMTR